MDEQVGQSLSVRPDICPQEYLDEFSELQVKIIVGIERHAIDFFCGLCLMSVTDHYLSQ